MYRYSQNLRGSMINTRLQRRMLRVLVVVLLIALIAVSILAGNATAFRNRYTSQYTDRILYEANQAVSISNTIPKSGGTTVFTLLSRVRQHIYTMQSMQDMHLRLAGEGNRIIPEATFTQVYNTIEAYDNAAKTSKTATEAHQLLLDTIQALYNIVIAGIE